MGFYIRKSVKLGPVRLNFSKSGMGVSAGVKGFHLGLDARGRGYVSGGAHGLYFREYARKGQPPGEEDPLEETGPGNSAAGIFALLMGGIILVIILAVLFLRGHDRQLVEPVKPASNGSALTEPGPRQYTVKRGDTLSGLAAEFYHSPAEWKKIYEANRQTVKDPNRLQVGMKLTMPEK